LVAQRLKLASRKDGLILDPFVGRGTTRVAVIATRRTFVRIEQNAEYLEIARQPILSVGREH
jgi:site-specific DNA-methyltransferase (adenine-specific)